MGNFNRVIILFLLIFSGLSHASDMLTAREIAERASEVDKYTSWSASIEVTQISVDNHKIIKSGITKMKLGDNGQPMRLFKFHSPGDIAGTSLLNIEKVDDEDNMWLYLPAIGRARQVASGNKKNSFVGTEFTFSDLATPKTDLYDHTIVGKEDVQGVEHYVVTSMAKDQNVIDDYGYKKVKSWISTENFTTSKVEYFDENGDKYKRQLVSDFEALDNNGHWLARQRTMENMVNKDKTVFMLEDVKKDIQAGNQFNPFRLGM